MKFLTQIVCLMLPIVLFAQDEKKDEVVTTGESSKVKFGTLIQLWNTTNLKSKDKGNETFNTFRIRRAEIKFSGDISEKVAFTVMFDPAKLLANSSSKPDTNTSVDKAKTKQSDFAILQDVFITYHLSKQYKIDLQVGQFKYPLTYEGLQSSAKLNFIERAEAVRSFGDKRDIGLQISAKPNQFVEGALMIVQGNSQNKTDGNQQKDFAGRVIAKPMSGLSVGGSFYKGNNGNDGKTPQNRFGGEAAYVKDAITTYGELIFAKDGKVKPQKSQLGGYAAFLYKLNDQWQPGVRYEYASTNYETASKEVPKTRLTFGVNYFVEKNSKIQLNYIYGKFSKKNGDYAANMLAVNWQVYF